MKLTITEIQEILPHRYPFLLLDSVEEVISWESCFTRSFNY